MTNWQKKKISSNFGNGGATAAGGYGLGNNNNNYNKKYNIAILVGKTTFANIISRRYYTCT